MPSRLRFFPQILVTAAALACALVTFSNSSAQGAPIGSPVSVTRNITMGGSNISNLLYDGTYVWVVEWSSNKVERINPSTGAIVGSPISVGANPGAAVMVNGHLFVGSGSNTVTDIDMSTATVTRTITLTGSNISRLVYDGTSIWALSWSSSKAERFNPSTGALVGSAVSVATNPSMGTIINGHLFVTGTSGSTVTDIDVSTGAVTRTITLSGSNLASSMFDGTNLWVTLFNDAKVARINPTTGAILGYTNVGTQPTNVILANGSVWVGATGSDAVTQIDSAGTVLRTIRLGGSNISNLVYDGAVIWAPNYRDAFISQINATTGAVIGTALTTGSNPGAIAIAGNSIFVGSSGSRVTQISGPTPTTTTSTTTTVAPATTTTTTTTTVAPTTTTTTTTTTVAPKTSTSTTTTVPRTTTTLSPVVTPTTAAPALSIVIQAPVSTVAQGQASVATIAPTTTSTTIAVLGANALPLSTTTTTPTTTVVPSNSRSVVATTVPPRTKNSALFPAPALVPVVAKVEAGQSAVQVDGVETVATVTRSNNQMIVNAGSLTATLSGTDNTGKTLPLDSDGNVRLSAGDVIKVSVGGFKPKSKVEVWLFSTPTQLGSALVGADGKINGAYKLPSEIEAGPHRFVVTAKLPNGKPTTFTIGILVGEISKTSTLTRVLIAIPILLAVGFGFLLPTRLRRRRQLHTV